MGIQKLPDRANGRTMDDNWWNAILKALAADIVPRTAAGLPSDAAGSLGSAAYRWLRAYVTTGHFVCGDEKLHFSFDGGFGPGHGWMLEDGRIVSEANYDAEHGLGSWDLFIQTSPLEGKRLPDKTDRYTVGALTTPQDGSAEFTRVGNPSHQISFLHGHQIYAPSGSAGTSDSIYNSAGAAAAVAATASKNSNAVGLSVSTGPALADALYTTRVGSAAFTVRPDSVGLLHYMRII